jgi:hypothetical protein
MRKERIEKAVEIINYAIQNQMSVKEASVKCGFSDTYVKNIKALVYELYEEGELDKDLFQQFDEAYKGYLYYRGFGIKEDETITEEKKPNDIPSSTSNEKTEFSEKGNEATIEWKSGSNYPADHIKTLPELLKICEVDQSLWDVAQFWVNKWDVTAIIDKMPKTFQNFQVKARLEKKLSVARERAIGELFKEMIKDYKAPVLNIPKFTTARKTPNTLENNLLEISLFDLHFGKLCWDQETGENFDIKIARQRFLATVEALIQRASGFQYDRILFPVGNDFFNSDTIFNTTTKGTAVDEDCRWSKSFDSGVKLLVDAINLLKQTGVPINVIVIPGNHDFEKTHYMGSFLEAWFNNDSQIDVNNSALSRKYYRFGKVLLGFTHGSEEKEGSLPLLMASDIESKPMWSETIFHEFHVGHVHRKRDIKYTVVDKSKMTTEDLGVTVRYLSSLTGTDAWHFHNGFIGAIKAGEGFIWNDETGMIAHLNANLVIE